jgi:hypothetical protein
MCLEEREIKVGSTSESKRKKKRQAIHIEDT